MAKYDDDDDEDVRDPDPPARDDDRPRPRVTVWTWVLIGLNLLAAGGFLALVLVNYRVRQEWSYATFRNVVALVGLPLDAAADETLADDTRPRLRLAPEQLKKAFTDRRGKGSPDFEFVDEPLPFRVTPAQLTDETKKKLFEGLGDPVGTVQEELAALKTRLPADIATKAAEVAGKFKTDADKRAAVEKVLLPLAWSTDQVDRLHQLAQAKAGADLDALLVDALQRRMYVDLLAPLNVAAPGDLENFKVETAADPATAVTDLKELLEARIDAALKPTVSPDVHFGKKWDGEQKRDSVAKREAAALLLFAAAQVRVPLEKEKLAPNGLERAQLVAGVYDLTRAAQQYTRALGELERRVVDAIKTDREGHLVALAEDKATRTKGFVGRYAEEIERLKKAGADLTETGARLADLQKQRDELQKVHDERVKQMEKAVADLTAARKETFRTAQETRRLQDQLYQAMVTLSDADAQIEALVNQLEKTAGGGREATGKTKKGRQP